MHKNRFPFAMPTPPLQSSTTLSYLKSLEHECLHQASHPQPRDHGNLCCHSFPCWTLRSDLYKGSQLRDWSLPPWPKALQELPSIWGCVLLRHDLVSSPCQVILPSCYLDQVLIPTFHEREWTFLGESTVSMATSPPLVLVLASAGGLGPSHCH